MRMALVAVALWAAGCVGTVYDMGTGQEVRTSPHDHAAGSQTTGTNGTISIPSLTDAGSPDASVRDAGKSPKDSGTVVPSDAGHVTPYDAGPPPPATPVGCLSILPLGDSITLGVNGGYRNELFKSLKAGGCSVNYVGSQKDQYTEIADKDHEGHPGYTIGDIDGEVNGWLTSYAPNTVLLMVGTNDIAWWSAATAQEIGADHAALVDKIIAKRPNAWVVVASIAPITSQKIAPNNVDRAQLGKALNAVIASNVAARVAQGKKVRFADVHAALTTADLYDGVHPTQAAHAKVAAAFYAALSPVVACTTVTACGP